MPDGFIRASSPENYLAAVLQAEREEHFTTILAATKEYAEGAVIGAVATTLGRKVGGPSDPKEPDENASSNRGDILQRAKATVAALIKEACCAFREASEASVSYSMIKALFKRIIRAFSVAFTELISLDNIIDAVWKSILSAIYRRLLSIYNALKDAFKPTLKAITKTFKLAKTTGLSFAEKIHKVISVGLDTTTVVAEGIISNLILSKIPVLTPLIEFIVRCASIALSSIFLAGSSLAHIWMDLCDVVQNRAIEKQRVIRQAALKTAGDKADRLLELLEVRGFRGA